MSLIRTYSYIKYARLNLDEASRALGSSQAARSAEKSLDAASAMMKAVSAALPSVDRDFFRLKQKALERYLADLTPDADAAARLAEILYLLTRTDAQGVRDDEDSARALFLEARKALSILDQIFPEKKHPLY
jgi:hypothetical protein